MGSHLHHQAQVSHIVSLRVHQLEQSMTTTKTNRPLSLESSFAHLVEVKAGDVLSLLQHAGSALVHLLDGGGGGQEGVVRGVEGGRAAVTLLH